MSSLPLMAIYIVIAFAVQGLAVGTILLVEPYLGGWSGVIFMTSYLLAFWLAWAIAVRITEPRSGGTVTASRQA